MLHPAAPFAFLGLPLRGRLALAYYHVSSAPVGGCSRRRSFAIVPLSEYIRLGNRGGFPSRSGSAIGGLLNVTFGNAPELILAIFILRAGEPEVVKAQITGAFIGNGLLGLGLAIVAGSIHREKQTFKKERASDAVGDADPVRDCAAAARVF